MKTIRSALSALAFFILATAAYTGAVTLAGALAFPRQAGGSLIVIEGRVRGSSLLGQDFSDPASFQGRPSASGYDPASGSASNQGPLSAMLSAEAAKRRAALEAENGGAAPPDILLTASGSGLDPDISPEAALYQIPRIARARALGPSGPEELAALVRAHAQGRPLGILGEPRVKVLELNLELDRRFPRR